MMRANEFDLPRGRGRMGSGIPPPEDPPLSEEEQDWLREMFLKHRPRKEGWLTRLLRRIGLYQSRG